MKDKPNPVGRPTLPDNERKRVFTVRLLPTTIDNIRKSKKGEFARLIEKTYGKRKK
jgi:hypothetical protein